MDCTPNSSPVSILNSPTHTCPSEEWTREKPLRSQTTMPYIPPQMNLRRRHKSCPTPTSTKAQAAELVRSKTIEGLSTASLTIQPHLSAISSLPFKRPLKAIYAMANKKAFLSTERTVIGTTGVLTLLVASDRYVKFRSLIIRDRVPHTLNSEKWLQVGSSTPFLIQRSDFNSELSLHNDPNRFGSFKEITAAVTEFEKTALSDIIELSSQNHPTTTKYTTRMTSSGQLRPVERRVIKTGSYKIIDEDTFLPLQQLQIARAKLKDPTQKNEPAALATLGKEAYWSRFLTEQGVPHVIRIDRSSAQNLQKLRLDMPLMSRGSLHQRIHDEPLTPRTLWQRYKYAQQLADTMAGIHGLNLTYNDLGPSNILIDQAEDAIVLIDLATIATVGKAASPGTFPAPEVPLKSTTSNTVSRVIANQKNDCWAYGLLLYALLHGNAALLRTRTASWEFGKTGILLTTRAIKEHLASSIDSPLLDPHKLIIDLLSENPSDRPTMAQVVERLKTANFC